MSWLRDEAGPSVAFAVENALRKRDATIDDLRRENEGLREAIAGVRQFAPVETLSPEAMSGYDLASKDLLLLAWPAICTNWDDLLPLGWGRSARTPSANQGLTLVQPTGNGQ